MPNLLQKVGALGEELAAQYLRARGYKILVRNYRCSLGEIDLVARHRDTLVFVEVKTRRSEAAGDPAESVTPRKRAQIERCALYYLKRYGMPDVPCRFDVVSVRFRSEDAAFSGVELLTDAFGGRR